MTESQFNEGDRVYDVGAPRLKGTVKGRGLAVSTMPQNREALQYERIHRDTYIVQWDGQADDVDADGDSLRIAPDDA